MTPIAQRLAAAEELLGYVFDDRSLLEAALTHPSHTAEHGRASYERLEFLGDSVLGFIVANELFRAHPESPEGELTMRKIAVVSGENLTIVSERLGLGQLVLLGKGETHNGGMRRASTLENVLEALVGAVYLDGGIDAARELVLRLLEDALRGGGIVAPLRDAKSALQEYTQARLGTLPEYRLVAQTGMAHDKTFVSEVLVEGAVAGTGTGRSKKESERLAAADAIITLGVRETGE